MGRPPKALITHASAVEASIEIIDNEGLDAFSLPRLAAHMGVRTPSLYHHFADKNAVMTAIARHIAGKTVSRPRQPPGEDWPEYFVTLALNFRQAILRHRNAAPVLLEHLPREVLLRSYEDAAEFLELSGVPLHLHAQILDGIETLCIGGVLMEAKRNPRGRQGPFPGLDRSRYPRLAAASSANDMTARELFAHRVRSFLYGVVSTEISSRSAEQHPA